MSYNGITLDCKPNDPSSILGITSNYWILIMKLTQAQIALLSGRDEYFTNPKKDGGKAVQQDLRNQGINIDVESVYMERKIRGLTSTPEFKCWTESEDKLIDLFTSKGYTYKQISEFLESQHGATYRSVEAITQRQLRRKGGGHGGKYRK